MKLRSLAALFLSALFWLAVASSAHADDFKVKAVAGEWKVENLSKSNITVTFEWTDLTFNRLEHATLIVPAKGEVRICPVRGNSAPEPVKRR